MIKYLATIQGDIESQAGDVSIMETVGNIINTLFLVVGIIAVIVIIIGGVQLATSAGDPNKAAKGKNSVMGGVIGLVISLLAFAIVSFVLNNI